MPQYLPSIEECQTFLAKINEGRALIDLPPIDSVDFDACTPNNGSESGAYAQAKHRLADGYGGYCCLGVACDLAVKADEILAVTGPFDALGQLEHPLKVDGPQSRALRARFVEAEIVID